MVTFSVHVMIWSRQWQHTQTALVMVMVLVFKVLTIRGRNNQGRLKSIGGPRLDKIWGPYFLNSLLLQSSMQLQFCWKCSSTCNSRSKIFSSLFACFAHMNLILSGNNSHQLVKLHSEFPRRPPKNPLTFSKVIPIFLYWPQNYDFLIYWYLFWS